MNAVRLTTALGAALLLGALTGCGAGTTTPPASPEPTSTQVQPTIAPSVPDGDSLIDWANSVLPEDSAGGGTYAQRGVGVVGPEEGSTVHDSQQEAGSTWVLQIACISQTGGDLSYELTVDGSADIGALPCTSATDPAEVTVHRFEFNGGVPATLRLSSDERTAFVYQIGEKNSDAD